MNAFDEVIGYNQIKNELINICDMIHNFEPYKALGATLPNGILIYGNPGMGKTLLAQCFIKECNINSYIIRNNKTQDELIDEITETFEIAKKNQPAIILLDDIDKFANEDEDHQNAPAYVTIQSCIDALDNNEVLIIATANNTSLLPDSLIRYGRFDRKYKIHTPKIEDSKKIIQHYLNGKKVSSKVNIDDITYMLSNRSCASLESIINEAAILAAYKRKEKIEMDDILRAVLKSQYHVQDNIADLTDEERHLTALHEAGHVVVAETLYPGCVGLASINGTQSYDSLNGFIHLCKDPMRRPFSTLTALGGKAAVEMYYSETCASGCFSDLGTALENIRDGISCSGTLGLGLVSPDTFALTKKSENYQTQLEIASNGELNRYFFKAKNILLKNKDFLEKVTDKLETKETLLYSDIQAIKSEFEVTSVSYY